MLLSAVANGAQSGFTASSAGNSFWGSAAANLVDSLTTWQEQDVINQDHFEPRRDGSLRADQVNSIVRLCVSRYHFLIVYLPAQDSIQAIFSEHATVSGGGSKLSVPVDPSTPAKTALRNVEGVDGSAAC